MSLFRWFILRQLRRERLRSVVTVAGIAVGIAVVVAIRLANASSVLGFETALDAMSGRVSLEVSGAGIGVPERQLSELAWLHEYGLVSPVIDADVRLGGLDQDRQDRQDRQNEPEAEVVRVLGVDILRDRPFRDYPLLEGAEERQITTQEFLALLTDPRAIVLTDEFARRHGLEVGSAVEMSTGDRRITLTVRGVLGREGPAELLDGNFALMDIAAAQWALGRLGRVDRVDVQLRENAEIEVVRAAIATRLPPGLTVQRPARRGAQVEKMLSAFHFNLTALSYIALIVGLFLVYNTVSVSVITRRSEIGMLRTVGASRRIVLMLFLGEAVSLATVGCLIGVPLGWVLARAAVAMTSATVSNFWVAAAAQVPTLEAGDILLGFLVGLPLAVFAAFVPALEAAGVTPVSAMRNEGELTIRRRMPWRYVGGAAGLLMAAAWCTTRPAVSGLPVFGLIAVLGVVFGAALLVPPVLHLLQRVPSPRWLRIEGELARTNLGGSIRRLSISVAALAVSLAMMVAIAIMIGSFRETVVYWVGQTLQADLFISAARQSPVGDRATVSARVEDAVVSHPAVVAVDGFRGIDVSYGESLIIVGSGRFEVLLEQGNLLFKAPLDGVGALADAIGRAAVVVSESFALKFDVSPGEVITLPTGRGDEEFLVTGVYYDYSTDRGLVVMDDQTFAQYYDDRRPAGLTVYLRDGADPDQTREEILGGMGPEHNVFINTNASLRRQVLRVFDSTFAVTYALEAIAIGVSVFGVAATLLTLALERRQQIAVLRLIGAERTHLRRMTVIEAALLGVVSLGIGLVVGVLLSLILIYVINVQSFGWTIQFHIPWSVLFRVSLLILVATTVAGLYPARLAGRFQIAELSAEG